MNNDERKYRKRVNENGWMIKLQRACWGRSAPEFVGYCPFFWFTWLSLLLSPILIPARGIFFVIGWAMLLAIDAAHSRPWRPSNAALGEFYEHYLDTLSRDPNALAWERENNQHVYGKILDWIDKTSDWENCAKRALLLRQKKTAAKEAAAETSAARRSRLSKLANRAHFIVKPIIVLGCCVGLFFVVRFLYFVFRHVTLHELWIAALFVGGILLASLTFIGLVSAILKCAAWCQRCPKRPNRLALLHKLGLAILRIFDAIGRFFEETVAAIYTRECPLIEWSDGDGPIETR